MASNKAMSSPIGPILLAVFWLFGFHTIQAATNNVLTKESPTAAELEQRLEAIDDALKQLSQYSLRSGIGSIGYRSTSHRDPNNEEWVKIQIERESIVDQVVLVPTIWRDAIVGFQSYGFPIEFQVRVGRANDTKGKVVAKFSASDNLLPRIAPLIIPVDKMPLSWVKVEATVLSPQKYLDWHTLQFAEIMIFSDSTNVALRQSVQASSNVKDSPGAWDKRFLVDGFLPYLMDSSQGDFSFAYISEIGSKPVITLDLGQAYPINEIHLHAIDQSDTVPQAYAGDLGIPKKMRIEGGLESDFSDAISLIQYQRDDIYAVGPVMIWNIPKSVCRFIRIIPEGTTDIDADKFRVGFAEIEIVSAGKNVALGKPIMNIQKDDERYRSMAALTDGKNLYGKILPIKVWMAELAQRHELEQLRPEIEQALNQRYARQKKLLRISIWLIVTLVVGVGLIVLVERNIRSRQAMRLKEGFAADLHDELGANLHTIRLLGDLAKDTANTQAEVIELLNRSAVFTERSINAVRHCTNIQEAEHLCDDLVEEMRRSSQRTLIDLKHKAVFQGEEILHNLKPRKRLDIFLFYKECLANIIRHSKATEVSTQLIATSAKIELTVTDNGDGLPNKSNTPPASLTRRARLMKASLQVKNIKNGAGTQITLTLTPKKWTHFK